MRFLSFSVLIFLKLNCSFAAEPFATMEKPYGQSELGSASSLPAIPQQITPDSRSPYPAVMLKEYFAGFGLGAMVALLGGFAGIIIGGENCEDTDSWAQFGCGFEYAFAGAFIGYGIGVPLGVHAVGQNSGYPGNIGAAYLGSLISFWFPPVTPLVASAFYHGVPRILRKGSGNEKSEEAQVPFFDSPRMAMTLAREDFSLGIRADILVFRF